MNKDMKILIVGLGLLGGSYARSLTRQGYTVKAITRSRKTIDYALEQGLIAEGTTEVSPTLLGEADLVVLALYPSVLLTWIRENQSLLKPGAILTDVTGIKGCIVGPVQELLRPDVEFIAAHPMAGRERSGIEHSDEAIFRGANYVVTPSERNTDGAIELCEDLGQVLGFARISRVSPEEHDDIIGYVSQLTHCIAVSLMTAKSYDNLEDYTGDSFRDLTRIARLNDEMWSELFLMNREALLTQIDLFEGEMAKIRRYLETENREALREIMRHSTARRALFDKKKR
ncbi:MAG: prephenate dehydrogenase [Clostridia bacterium]|nr:prephenate dehydrogenase [Clostridia bacterium]